MTNLGTWAYERDPRTGKLVRVHKTRIHYDGYVSSNKTADDYNGRDDFARSIDEAYRAIRERKKNGGPGWGGWE